MTKLVTRVFDVYEEEVALFLWSALLLFVIRGADILFNNVAETAFLKRYGVQYLPIVYMINAVSTFFIMGALTGIMARMPDSRLLNIMLVGSGVFVAAMRFLIPLGIDLIYPVLFILKSQLEVLLALVFWNMANDLFNTRQSKRLFPLITAGGVIGAILGSFATSPLAKLIRMDNLLLAYLGVCLIGAVVVRRMVRLYPVLLVPESGPKAKGKGKKRSSMLDEFKKVGPLLRESTLLKVLIVLTLMPNIVIPLMNYQFNFAVNDAYATEGGMIKFFAFFRGFLNIISLVILLFVGKIYGKWGLPVALMIHPFNYLLAFFAFLLRFDIFSAMYARISTNVFRTTVNNPARAVLMGLFPPAHRAIARPFLRGTVVRIGTLLGSGAIMLVEGVFHPRYLSVVGIVAVSVWLAYDFVLKRKYSKILLDLISKNMVDLKSLEEKDLGQVFRDRRMQGQLIEGLLGSRGEEALWYAQLLRTQGLQDLDRHLLAAIRNADEETRLNLLPLLSPEAAREALPVFREIADPERPELMACLARTANRLGRETGEAFAREIRSQAMGPDVKAYVLVGLYGEDPERSRETIASWLDSGDLENRRAGIVAAGESGEKAFVPRLRGLLDSGVQEVCLPLLFRSLRHLEDPDLNALVKRYFSHASEEVRRAALEAFELRDEDGLRGVIALMGDPAEAVAKQAVEKIAQAPFQNPLILVESLNTPRRAVREGLFELLETLDVKGVDVYRFARKQIEESYVRLAEAHALKDLPPSPVRDLLMDHLLEDSHVGRETLLRVLSAQDASGQMRIIWRGISSSDPRQRSNSIEALDDVVDATLAKVMVPLIEDMPQEDRLKIGARHFQLPDFHGRPEGIVPHLLTHQDWVTALLTLTLVPLQGEGKSPGEAVAAFLHAENPHVRRLASQIMAPEHSDPSKREQSMEKEISIPDRILRLKKITIFEGLSVSELAAIASVAEEMEYEPGSTIIKEGDRGDTMFLIIGGDVSVIKEAGKEGAKEVELARIGVGNAFGEMALFEDSTRSATIRAVTQTRLLVLDKREFTEIVREYPQIALHICKVLSGRIRELHDKVQAKGA